MLIVEQHEILIVKMVLMLDDSHFHLFPNLNCL